jgi:hypothetical protein
LWQQLSWDLSAAGFAVLVLQAGVEFREFSFSESVRSKDATPSDFLPQFFGIELALR